MSKIIVITGGSDGLGKTLTEDFSKDNKVIILSPTEEKLKKVAAENNCDYFVCDVTNYETVQRTIKSIIDKYSRIDVLINNAGLWVEGELENNDPEIIKKVIDVNLFGTINTTRSVISNMKSNNDGIIININSQGGISYKSEKTIYNASKWGLNGFTGSLQLEVAKYGIRVVDVYPGKMKTDIFKKMNVEKNMDNALDTKEVSRLIRFIIDTPKNVMIPSVEIKHINS